MTYVLTCLVQAVLVGVCTYGCIRIVQTELDNYRFWKQEMEKMGGFWIKEKW